MKKVTLTRRIMILLVVLITIKILCSSSLVKAGVIEDSTSYNYIENSLGDIVTTISMNDGVIKVVTKAHAATTNIRWKLVGFTITKVEVPAVTYDYYAEEGVYQLDGFKNVSTVYDQGYGTVMLKSNDTGTTPTPTPDPATGILTTTRTISAQEVTDALTGEKFSDIVQNTPIYLQGIFCVYSVDKYGNETVFEGMEKIKNWKEILLAKYWDRTDRQLEDFSHYFNMKIDFQPAPQPNTINYYTEGNLPMGSEALTSVKPGLTVYWNSQDAPATMPYNEKTYELCRYVVVRKGTTQILDGPNDVGESDNYTLAKVQNRGVQVPLGGVDVNMYYRLKEDVTLEVNAVDKKTNQILQQFQSGTVLPDSDFSKDVNNTINISGVSYKKTGDYAYTYERSGGGTGTGGGLLNDTLTAGLSQLKFHIPKDVKNSTKIVANVYYDPVAGDIPVSVVGVNKKTGTEIQTLSSGSVKGGGTFDYTALESLTSGTKTYQFTGSWDWQYTQKSSTSPTIVKSGSTTKVNFTAPTIDKITGGIKVKVYYVEGNPASNSINLRVIMVSGNGALIDEISVETVTRGQAISKSILSPKSVNGMVYNYLNKWDCEYTTSAGAGKTSGTGTTAAFNIPTGTLLGSTVTLKLYYEATQVVTVPNAAAPISLPLDSPSPYGVINGDKYGSSYFTSKDGIPTTESQYVFVKTKDYLLGYRLVNRTGKEIYYVPVTMHYSLKYQSATPASDGGPQPITEDVPDKKLVRVEKAYSYWEIESLEYYYINNANVYNYSLPGGGVNLVANNAYLNLPSMSTWHSSDIKDHVTPPKQVTDGIELFATEPIVSTTSDRPNIEYEDLTAYAIKLTEEAKVRNDLLMFNGSMVLANDFAEKIAPQPNTLPLKQSNTIIPDKTLFTEGKVIDALKVNGKYTSSGNVIYSLHPSSVNARYSNQQYNVDVNSVTIHTPVICDPVLTADNGKWSQALNSVDGAVQIVLDKDISLNDFTIRISNNLQHSNRLGYYARDFSRSYIEPYNVSYIAKKDGVVRNEMKLPFDVYMDVLSDGNINNDKFIKAGTWIILGRETYRFYVPMWVMEGLYTAEFRTVAVNGTDRLNRDEATRNTDINNYVATSVKTFQVSGRIYGLTLYDVSDAPNWDEVFRFKNSTQFKYFDGATDGTKRTGYDKDYAYYYTVGTKDQYGNETGRQNKYTIPMVNGSHPKYKNLGVLKTGYAVRFRLDTTGDMYSNACFIKIAPTFYYVDKNGNNRRQVDLYYDEEINGTYSRLVKVGDGLDLVNIKSGINGNSYSRIPESEIINTAAILNTTYDKFANQRTAMYSYSQIRILNAFRTFVGKDYAAGITGMESFDSMHTLTRQTEQNLSKYTQRWYGIYKLPMNVHAVPTGYDVRDYLKKYGIDYKENFWLTDGYIITNFNIVTIDKNGKEHLSYINSKNYLNKGNCSMWVTEGGMVQKTDSYGTVFNLKAGDFFINYTDKKYIDDYEGKLY